MKAAEYHTYKVYMAEADYNKRLGDSFKDSSSPRYNIARTYYRNAELLYNKAATTASIYGEKGLREKASNEMHECRKLIAFCSSKTSTIITK